LSYASTLAYPYYRGFKQQNGRATLQYPSVSALAALRIESGILDIKDVFVKSFLSEIAIEEEKASSLTPRQTPARKK
jgi:hypothetical protein